MKFTVQVQHAQERSQCSVTFLYRVTLSRPNWRGTQKRIRKTSRTRQIPGALKCVPNDFIRENSAVLWQQRACLAIGHQAFDTHSAVRSENRSAHAMCSRASRRKTARNAMRTAGSRDEKWVHSPWHGGVGGASRRTTLPLLNPQRIE